MLGVIGIHVGSQYLMNPSANAHLVAVFEIVTRFAVPIFFFISAFGLFYNLDMSKTFNYKNFMQRRFKTVLIPYLTWSFFYIIHDNWHYGYGMPDLSYLLKLIFLGLSKYHLYFLVILLWFYLLMPLWIKIVKEISPQKMILLLIVQIVFDYFSSYSTALNNLIYSLPETSFLRELLYWRLNYLVLHYVFIFVLGGYLAVHIDKFFEFMRNNKIIITLAFILSLISLMTYYYILVFVQKVPLEAAVNTAHQLSPLGIIYTITASIFFFTLFSFVKFSDKINLVLSILGKHSYFAYLFHPFIITYLTLILQMSGRIMTAPIAIVYYFVVVILSIVIANKFRTLGAQKPLINKLTIGLYPRR